MSRFISAVTMLMISIGTIKAQELQHNNNTTIKEERTIEVIGYAAAELVPNIIYVSFTIKDLSNQDDGPSIIQQDKAIREAIKKVGASIEDLQVSNVLGYTTLNIQQEKEEYAKARSYSMKFKSIASIDQFLSLIDMRLLNNFMIDGFDHDALHEEIKKMQLIALDRGKFKADNILNAFNKKRGELIRVQEVQSNIIYPKIYVQQQNIQQIINVNNGIKYEQVAGYNIQQIKMEYQIRLVFEIQ